MSDQAPITRLIIARHGNTFTADQTPTRVGARTDLPLVDKGRKQGRMLGLSLASEGVTLDRIYASRLMRTQQTAQEAMRAMNIQRDLGILSMLDEVDYGPDENKPEEAVIKRIGQDAITAWDQHAIVPDGWLINTDIIINSWLNFAKICQRDYQGQTILMVTSNGIARFAPHITGDYEVFKENHTMKLSTGAYGVMELEKNAWRVKSWNVKTVL